MADLSKKQKAAAFVSGGMAAAASFVIAHEGLKESAYADPALGWEVPTICVGHTLGVKKGDKATQEQCLKYLSDDLKQAGNDVARCVIAPITQGQFDALVSFQFNTGAICKASLTTKLNTGDCRGAANEFLRWVKSGGKVMPGLVTRRAAEKQLFEAGC